MPRSADLYSKLIDYKATPDLVKHLQTLQKFDVVYETNGQDRRFPQQCGTFLNDSGNFVDITPFEDAKGVVDMLKAVGVVVGRKYVPAWLGGGCRRYHTFSLNEAAAVREVYSPFFLTFDKYFIGARVPRFRRACPSA